MNTIFEVLDSESNNKLKALRTNASLCAFVQGVIQHMALAAAGRGLPAASLRVSSPRIEEDDVLCATVRWDGAVRFTRAAPEPMQARGNFLDFLSHENSAYVEFFRANRSLQQFVEKLLEATTGYANHWGVPLTAVVLETPFVAHDQYIRARLGVWMPAPEEAADRVSLL